MNVFRSCIRPCRRLAYPTRSRFFCSENKEKHTELEGFNQVLRISFQTSPAAVDIFETVVSKFAGSCLQDERPHLQKLDVLKQQNSSSNFTIFQTYNSREGFMNHRMSKHFVEFMQTSGPLMTDDVDLLEYTSLFPPPNEWVGDTSPDCTDKEDRSQLRTIQVSMTAQEDKETDFILATRRHCEDTMRYFSSGSGTDDSNSSTTNSSSGTSTGTSSTANPPPPYTPTAIRMYLMQNTQDSCQFVLLLVVRADDQDAVLKKLKDSASYMQWSESMFALLEAPRSSQRFENLL